ncbi:MAG: GFA family protein [Proteobacteria bacterium]|nr:GFA family protein [Pseudomonadota bacterium]
MRGNCLCGSVAFEVAGELPKLYQCHCSLCRKQSGTTSNCSLLVQCENFRWLDGESNITSYVKDSGFRSDFCARCGSPVPNPLRDTTYVWVPSGLLDGKVSLEVGAHLCVGSKASWDTNIIDGTQFEDLPNLETLIECLKRR